MPHCRTLAYPLDPEGNYYARAWGASEGASRRPRRPPPGDDHGQRVSMPSYPGICK